MLLGVEVDDEYVDKNLALTGEPIDGTDKVVYDEETGPGALEAAHCHPRRA